MIKPFLQRQSPERRCRRNHQRNDARLESRYKRRQISITDRREAIKTAINLAQPKDIILVAGKGHEKYQEIKGVKYHFDDKEELLKMFELLDK